MDNSEYQGKPLVELFQPGYKVWLERGGTNFGDGLYHLLLNVKRFGSISQAAKEMGMSYRAAWGKIRAAENDWGFRLLSTQVGGDTGGGASLTSEGDLLLTYYSKFRDEVNLLVEKLFVQCFEK